MWDLPGPGVEPMSPVLQANSLPLSHQGSPDEAVSEPQGNTSGPPEPRLKAPEPLREVKQAVLPDAVASLSEGVTSPGTKLPATHHSLNACHLTALHLWLHFQPTDLGLVNPTTSRNIRVRGLRHFA